jgi:predicted ArsR family transcriptional regulator
MKRWDAQGLTVTQRAILDRIKAIGPLTIQELCAELELSREGARKAINGLHRTKLLYIRDWPYQSTQRSRQWALRTVGQQDAQKPPACTRSDYDRRFRERHKITIARRKSMLPPSPFQGLMT